MCLQLIEHRTHGILMQLDNEGRIPKGSDERLLEKLDDQFTHLTPNPCYVKMVKKRGCFTIKHFAGRVVYRVEGFLQKNNDRIDEGGLLSSSDSPLIAVLNDLGNKKESKPSPKSTERIALV